MVGLVVQYDGTLSSALSLWLTVCLCLRWRGDREAGAHERRGVSTDRSHSWAVTEARKRRLVLKGWNKHRLTKLWGPWQGVYYTNQGGEGLVKVETREDGLIVMRVPKWEMASNTHVPFECWRWCQITYLRCYGIRWCVEIHGLYTVPSLPSSIIMPSYLLFYPG